MIKNSIWLKVFTEIMWLGPFDTSSISLDLSTVLWSDEEVIHLVTVLGTFKTLLDEASKLYESFVLKLHEAVFKSAQHCKIYLRLIVIN